jgi:2-methylcitrate dehydratase PrpD
MVGFIGKTTFGDLPALARTRAVACVADTIGVMAAGASCDIADRVLAALRDAGSLNGKHPLIGTAESTNALDAALFNGVAAHALDYDDVNHPGPMHPGCHLVPALLALSSVHPASGQEFVLAYLIGFEIDAKLGRLLNPRHYDRGWHATSTIGTVAAAAAGASLLGLDPEATENCLSIAASSAAGLRGNIGSMAKPLHAGAAARAGVQAALLASHGFTGTKNILERRHGYFDAFGDDLDPDFGPLRELGSIWDIESEFGVGLKPYPCCGEATAAVEAALDLAGQSAGTAIEKILVATNERATRILTYPRPTTVEEARFSMPFCLATALVHRRADLSAFSTEALADEQVNDLIRRVEHVIDEQYRHEREFGAIVRITLADGRELERIVPVAKGWAGRWLTEDEQLEKFVMCTRGYLSQTDARDLHRLVISLESLPDVSAIVSRLMPAAQ